MTRRQGSNVTLKDIAERVGVSAMTVSRALSGKESLVNPETVRRIRAVAQEMGYSPNLLARSLRGERLPTIVVFAEFISSHQYLASLVDFVARAIESHGYSVIACQSGQSLLESLRQFKLAGAVILAPPESLLFDEKGRPRDRVDAEAPVVLIHSAVEQPLYNEVSPDLTDAAYQSAAHLVGLGHRRIGFLGGPPPEEEPQWFRKRRVGIERALSEGGLPPDVLHYQPCPNADVAPAFVQQMLQRIEGLTGLLCLNDEIALAAISGLHERALRVPRDLSVVGSNDIHLARFFRPALTTISIDIQTMVDTGLNLLFEEIRRGHPAAEAAPVKVLQKCELIVRESSGRAGGA